MNRVKITLIRSDQVIASKVLEIEGRGYSPLPIAVVRWLRTLTDSMPLRKDDELSYTEQQS